MIALTRTCSLADFPDCRSVGDWQQRLVEAAHTRWALASDQLGGPVLCINWGASNFRSPGASEEVRYFEQVGGSSFLDAEFASAVFALSVLDRIDQPLHFLREIAYRLDIGGLIVCTFAAWDVEGEDCAGGHDLRCRIYDLTRWRKLIQTARSTLGLIPFGGVDLEYRGNTLGDRTLASLVVTKTGGGR